MQVIKMALLLISVISVSSSFADSTASVYDLSTPQKSLEALIAAEKAGDWHSAKAIYSTKLLSSIEELENIANKLNLKNDDSKFSDNPYENIKVLREDIVNDRAALYVEARYRKDWLKEQLNIRKGYGVKEYVESANSADDALVSADDSKQTIDNLDTGLLIDFPCEKNGIGYVIYFFVKEDNIWKFISGITFRTSINPMKFSFYRRFLEKNMDIK